MAYTSVRDLLNACKTENASLDQVILRSDLGESGLTEEESRADEEFSLSVGQSLDITCPARDYTNYQQFTWEIVEGTGLAELTGVVARTCTLTALRPGTVLLRSTYEYGIDEPDVLTGFPRNVNRSETRTYLITIS